MIVTPRLLSCLAGLWFGTVLTAQIVPPLPKIPLGKPPATGNPTPPKADDPQPPAGAETAAAGGVGIAFQPDQQGNLVVAQLAPGGAAERAKVPVGAVLRAVDGKRVQGLSLEQVRALCVGAVGSMVTLTLETEREVLDVVLQRRPLTAPANGAGGNGPGGGPAPTPQAGLGAFPDWLRPGARATYFSGQATMPGVSTQLIPDESGFGWKDGNGRTYREDQVPSSGGGGLTQYDIVQVAPDCVAAMMSIHTFTDVNLQQTTLTGAQPLLGDQNGLGDLWLPPAKLRAMLEQETPGYRVRRVKYPLNGRTYDALVQQTKSDSSWMRYTYDLDTGLMLVFSASSAGAPVLTRNGNQMTQGAGGTTITSVVLRNVRTVSLPWTGQQAPQWLQAGKQLEYAGTFANSLMAGTLAPWRYGISVAVEKRVGECTVAKVVTRLDYGNGQPQETPGTLVYGPGSFANLFLDPRTLQKLQPGQVLDRDPVTGRQLSFAGSDGRTATILEQGPLDQQSYMYDLQSGVLLGTSQRQQQGPAVISIDVQLRN